MPEIKAMTFAVGDEIYRLLFAPDDYMTALIGEKLRAGNAKRPDAHTEEK